MVRLQRYAQLYVFQKGTISKGLGPVLSDGLIAEGYGGVGQVRVFTGNLMATHPARLPTHPPTHPTPPHPLTHAQTINLMALPKDKNEMSLATQGECYFRPNIAYFRPNMAITKRDGSSPLKSSQHSGQ